MKKRYLFRRFLLSYLIILIVPLGLLLGLVWRRSAAQYRADELASVEQSIEHATNLIADETGAYSLISDAIAGDRHLSPFWVEHSTVDKIAAIEELAKYTQSHPQIRYAILYYRQTGISITAEGTESFSTFFQLEVPNLRIEGVWFKLLLTPDQAILPIYGRRSDESEMLAFFYPVPPTNQFPFATLVLFVKSGYLRRLLESVLYPGAALSGRVHDGAGNTVFRIGELEHGNHEFEGGDGNWIKSGSRGAKYHERSFDVGVLGWKCDISVSAQSLNTRSRETLLYLIVFSAAVFLGGILLVFVSMRVYYRPQKKFLQDLETMSGEKLEKSPWEKAEMYFANLARENKLLHQQEELSQSAVRDLFVSEVLRGEFDDIAELNYRGSQYGVRLEGDVMFAAFFMILNSGKFDKRSIIKHVEGSLPEGFTGCGKDRTDRDLIPFAFAANIRDIPALQKRFSLLIEGLNESLNLVCIVSIGTIETNPQAFELSRQKAIVALRYQQLYRTNDVQFFDEMDIDIGNVEKITEELCVCRDEIIKHVLSGDAEAAETCIDTYVEKIQHWSLNPVFAKSFMYLLLNRLHLLIRESGIVPELIVDRLISVNVPMGFDSVAQFESITRKICRYIVENSTVSDKSQALMLRVDAYIGANFDKPDFSVETMADAFHISRSYLSRAYRACRSHTLSVAIRDRRLAEAKKLLRGGNISVEAVATRVGYGDVSHFIKIFKNSEGVTPKQYRDTRLQRAAGS
jgi:two-component system, response regulator YesN